MAGGIAITFPAFDELPEKKLFLATRDLEGDDGETYTAALAEMPFLRSQKGLGRDGLDFSINDPQSVWYEELTPYEDVVVDTQIVAREFLLTEGDAFESEIVLVGFLEQMNLSESSLQIQFSAVSDMSRTGFLVGGRILTQRYCAARFNKNGLRNPLFDACGWTLAQGGNPLSCTHKRKGAGGCEDHLNEHRYFAVEALTTAQITTTSGMIGGGFDYGGGMGGCFTPRTPVWMADGSTKPIHKIEKGDLVWSFTKEGVLVKRKVLEISKTPVDAHLVFDFGRGRTLEPTTEHLMLVAPDLFSPAGALEAGDTLRSRNDEGWFDPVIRNSRLEEKRTFVHNLMIEETETYFVVAGDLQIGVHNSKLEV